MPDERSSPIIFASEGLFSERQIVLPLTIALLITFASYLTFAHFYDPAAHSDLTNRYIGNGYCQAMISVFVPGKPAPSPVPSNISRAASTNRES